jgi:uncharacterized alkaline shock family protein YloU
MNELISDIVLARAISQVAREVPGVADLYAGNLGQIATYGPGGRVPGVRVRREAGQVLVEIHLTISYVPALNILALAETVRSRLSMELTRLAVDHVDTIDVVIADLVAESLAPRSATR